MVVAEEEDHHPHDGFRPHCPALLVVKAGKALVVALPERRKSSRVSLTPPPMGTTTSMPMVLFLASESFV